MAKGKFDFKRTLTRFSAAGGGLAVWGLNKIPFVDGLNPEMKAIGKALPFAVLPEAAIALGVMKKGKGTDIVDDIAAGAIGATAFEYMTTRVDGNTTVQGIGNRDYTIDEDYMVSGTGDRTDDVQMNGTGDRTTDVMMP